jgi:hypothetical protein
MMDARVHLEKLRIQVVECEMIRGLATDPRKRELFNRLAEHHRVLVAEIERVIAEGERARSDPVPVSNAGPSMRL